MKPDPKLDLVLERVVDVPPRLVWLAWTKPEHLVKWFTPVPWKTTKAELDVRPGGRFFTNMQSPEGEDFPSEGCYLEVVPERRLVFTSALKGGWRPVPPGKPENCGSLAFTCILELEPEGSGTRYRATAMHADEEDSRRHAEMGFQDGWGKALDQLVELARSL